ncbi:MAG: RluA family pseudouridine synthase [Mycoplasma sp.]|nr:RluA family pseudouridine synthase [Mycoplasma sp.]
MINLVVAYQDRVDKYISDNSSVSRTDIQFLIKEDSVTVNGIHVRKPNFQVKEGDKINVSKLVQKEVNIVAEDIPIEIIYEDEDLAIVNKKSGMVVHPAPGHPGGTLVNGLMFKFQDQLSDINGQARPGIVHRIDKDTSGLLVVAKHNRSHTYLAQLIKEHKVKRTYIALLEGRVTNEITHIDLPIGRDSKNRQKMAVTRNNSKQAKSHFFVEKVQEKTTLIKCELETGRTHQIRVHASHIGHPVVGDPLYGKRLDDFGQRLHAYKLKFIHPNGKEMEFEAPVPKEFFENVDK